ncbi:ABC transporter ATP-binding protein [Microbulbifer magnicolonia]|uniref:ABC transporter ATP-binding protein n=1 Tax=Microbulbifer magnicolonia TaxID=3109744 RepID=UPI002B404651|nr:ATP-binding cassette domain-containing protein [Microbulbifer sp. GG15]
MTDLTLDKVSAGTMENVGLTVAAGEIVCLSGPSGAGKSRLLRAIADLEPHGGTVRLGDMEQVSVPGHRWRRAVMMVPTESAWWFGSVGEHLHKPMPEALRALGFNEDTTDWSIDRLSSGERQRLALVRALSREPQALLLDEPTANLDEKTSRHVEKWLQSVIREHQCPVLWVAHDKEQIRRVAKRHFHIEGSQLVERELRG